MERSYCRIKIPQVEGFGNKTDLRRANPRKVSNLAQAMYHPGYRKTDSVRELGNQKGMTHIL